MEYVELLIKLDAVSQLIESGASLAVVSPASAGLLMGKKANTKELESLIDKRFQVRAYIYKIHIHVRLLRSPKV